MYEVLAQLWIFTIVGVVRKPPFWSKGHLTSTTFVWSRPTFNPERWVPKNSGMDGSLPHPQYLWHQGSLYLPCFSSPPTPPMLRFPLFTLLGGHLVGRSPTSDFTSIYGCLHHLFTLLEGRLCHLLPCWTVAYVTYLPCWMVAYVVRF